MFKTRRVLITLAAAASLAAGVVVLSSFLTEQEIDKHTQTVTSVALQHPMKPVMRADWKALPAPVQAYFQYTFKKPPEKLTHVALSMAGDFRRPLTTEFMPTTASQTIAVATPALVFDATTPIIPGIWARAYDAFAEGKMQMKAKILSTITVVDEMETPVLNRTSLRRWLLESPLYPMALLPGGPVSWEAIDNQHARATVSAFGYSASLVAAFNPDGSLERFYAEEDGDLNTPYHGSGEYVLRSGYKEVQGMMIPMKFTIARAAKGEIYPFWKGEIKTIAFHNSNGQ